MNAESRPDWYMETGPGGLRFLRSRLLDSLGTVGHFFTLRPDNPEHRLNMGLHVGDDPLTVIRNRHLVLGQYGMDPARLTVARQVHGNRVTLVGADEAGRGAVDHGDSIPDTDGLITGTAGQPLMGFYADCIPVFLADRKGRAAGILHAGWRGMAGGIPARGVEAFCGAFGADPSELVAVTGPGIGPCCFEVGKEVAGAFSEAGLEEAVIAEPEGHRVDLPGAAQTLLLRAGIRPENLAVWRMCTCCGPQLFHSHRRDGSRSGRMAAVIVLHREYDRRADNEHSTEHR